MNLYLNFSTAMMVYEVNLKLRFLPADGQTSNRHAVRKKFYSRIRPKGGQRPQDADYTAQKIRKTKHPKNQKK